MPEHYSFSSNLLHREILFLWEMRLSSIFNGKSYLFLSSTILSKVTKEISRKKRSVWTKCITYEMKIKWFLLYYWLVHSCPTVKIQHQGLDRRTSSIMIIQKNYFLYQHFSMYFYYSWWLRNAGDRNKIIFIKEKYSLIILYYS